MAVRNIVSIDESKCNGCGLCIPNCAEGALAIVDGKARLVKDSYCDGLGACLGACPQDAIQIEQRDAADFDEAAALAALAEKKGAGARAAVGRERAAGGMAACGHEEQAAQSASSGPAGCPGMRVMQFAGPSPAAPQHPAAESVPGAMAAAGPLGHWPVQLSLLPLEAPFYNDCDLVLAADCTAFAAPTLIAGLVPGRAVAVGCPKLDDAPAYADKLAEILRRNAVRGLVLVHMEVPCCGGIVAIAREAALRSGRTLPVRDITVGCRGDILRDQLDVLGGQS
jgi:Pyruvate/2-oxoacid:ferredoxin oxidoreductase delta subunit